METTRQPTRPAWEHRLHAVLALLGGEPVPQVTARFGIGRSVLYKWRHRALTALQGALTDHRPGPQCPANRLSAAQEAPLVALAQRHPTWSAAQIQAQAGPEAPSPRTIQRLRHRYELPRLPKRPAPCRPARRLTRQVKQEARRLIEAKPWLGPERLAWELQNVAQMQISPATMQADEARQAAGPDTARRRLRSGASTHVITPIVSGMVTAWKKSLTRRPGGSSISSPSWTIIRAAMCFVISLTLSIRGPRLPPCVPPCASGR